MPPSSKFDLAVEHDPALFASAIFHAYVRLPDIRYPLTISRSFRPPRRSEQPCFVEKHWDTCFVVVPNSKIAALFRESSTIQQVIPDL